MKKAIALFLVLALIPLLALPAQAAGTLLIEDYVRITEILVYYTDGTTQALNLSTLYGASPIFIPPSSKSITRADITCTVLKNCYGYYDLTTVYPLTAGFVGTFTIFGTVPLSFSAVSTGSPAFLTISINSIGKLLRINTASSTASVEPLPKRIYPSNFIVESTPVPARPSGQRATILSGGVQVPVYDGFSEGAKVIGWVKHGETVYLDRWKNNFCYLLYNNESNLGWVEGQYIWVP